MNKFLDSTLISTKAKIQDYINLAENAIKYNFRAIVIPTFALDYVKPIMKKNKNNVLVSVVIDFPYGLSSYYARLKDIEYSVNHYANEIDLVINPVFINMNKLGSIEDELLSINENFHIPVKAIVDFTAAGITYDGKTVSAISNIIGVSHIKTSTGYFKFTDLELAKKYIKDSKKVKVAGVIRTNKEVHNFLKIGTDIIGTSNAESIIKEYICENTK